MPRTPRLLRSDEPSVYHVISRTALDQRKGDRYFMLSEFVREIKVNFARYGRKKRGTGTLCLT